MQYFINQKGALFMNMMIVKQYLKNGFIAVMALLVVSVSMLIGDKFQPFTYLELTTNYLHQTEVKKTVVHSASSKKTTVSAATTTKKQAQAPKKDALWEHVGKIAGEYVVKKGDTLWSIARKHKVPPQKLLSANNMTRDTKLSPGQLITIPKNG
ncbi:MAG: LysM peptidoglycan-binding domain-containing protein [Patescibacteria group bacterium]|nr:LysM peptidoglycan-binding domain-containing protein [Patescibacteria group bacterium]